MFIQYVSSGIRKGGQADGDEDSNLHDLDDGTTAPSGARTTAKNKLVNAAFLLDYLFLKISSARVSLYRISGQQ
jgi:hypothetical protein